MGGDTTTGTESSTSPSGQGQQQQQQQRDPQKKPPLSCTSCRTRKLKCDKQDPCHNCLRTGSECVFPARKRIQRPRKTKNTELLRRLNRLESIVGKVGLADLDEADAPDGVVTQKATTDAVAEAEGSQQQLYPAIAVQPNPRDDGLSSVKDVTEAPHDPTASRYLSGEFWSSLCDEVGGLRQALEQSTDSEEDTGGEVEVVSPESVIGSGGGGGGGRMSVSVTSPGMLLGTLAMNNVRPIEHPSPDHIRYLASAFFRNVDMHLKILHRPTILNALYNLADYPETASDLSPERESLFFAIYYAAVTSISPLECTHNLRRPRADLSSLFQAGFEQALVRADYLNNTSLETLQALTLYTCCLRSHNGSRASWALLGLPIRLAQALNMHQDGDGTTSRLSPYEAEMRRRLWWQLIVLDIRAAEDRGTNTIIARGSYNTRLPYNIDDAEFGPDTKTPLKDRPGPSDATFSLCAAQSSGLFLYFEHAQGAGPVQSEDDTVRQAQHLESLFVKGADPGHVGSYLASVTVRLIILKMWLVMRYPLHPRVGKPGSLATGGGRIPATQPPTSASEFLNPRVSSQSQSQLQETSSAHPPTSTSSSISPGQRLAAAVVSGESTLRTALSIIELHEFMQTGPYSDRFRWWTDTYVQWHPLAVALAELCTQTRGEAVERAWQIVDDVFPRWSGTIADTKRGSLWRPLRKLYKKAKAAREATLAAKGKTAGEVARQSQAQAQVPVSASWGPSASTSSLASTLVSTTCTSSHVSSSLEPHGGGSSSNSSSKVYTIYGPGSETFIKDTAMRDVSPGSGSGNGSGSGIMRPRLITDMIISESAAHSHPRDLPPAYNSNNNTRSTTNTNTTTTTTTTIRTINPETDSIFAPKGVSHVETAPPPNSNPNFNLSLNFDPMANDMANSLAQSWFAWPDLNFDIVGSIGGGNTAAAAATGGGGGGGGGGIMPTQTAIMDGAGTGAAAAQHGLALNDPALLDESRMDWTTWDEFVLDTYADSTPKSGSGASEAS